MLAVNISRSMTKAMESEVVILEELVTLKIISWLIKLIRILPDHLLGENAANRLIEHLGL